MSISIYSGCDEYVIFVTIFEISLILIIIIALKVYLVRFREKDDIITIKVKKFSPADSILSEGRQENGRQDRSGQKSADIHRR